LKERKKKQTEDTKNQNNRS